MSGLAQDPTHLYIHWVPAIFVGARAAGRGAGQSPSSRAEVNNV